MRFTYHGHSTFLLELDSATLLFDPFISGNEKAIVRPEDIICNYVLLSHGHQDHVLDAESILQRTGAHLISNFEIVTWYGDKGIDNATAMNLGAKVSMDFGTVKYVNAVHSSVLPDGSNGGNPGGFVIQADGKQVYYAGDTALTMDMELLGRYHEIDIAALPLGDTFTMGVEDAVIAAGMVGASKVIGMHYDTWPPLAIDHEKAIQAFADAGIELHLLEIGASLSI